MSDRRNTDLFFLLRGFPRFFRKFKLWILLALGLLILLALGPVLGPLVELLASAVRAIGTVLLPVLDNTVGRFLLVNAVAITVIFFFYRRFKRRGRLLTGAWALDRFLAGLLHLSAARYRRAASAFEQILRVSRWVDLTEGVEVYPEIVADARIKLSLCYRELGDAGKAMKSLELLKVRDLSPAMRRELAEAKAFVYALSGDLMEETVDREIATALEADGSNARLLRLRRDRAARLGDFDLAIAAQRRLLKSVPASRRTEERSELAALHARNALRLHHAGKSEEALAEVARSRGLDPNLVIPSLLAGDIAAERGDMRAAVKEWVRTPSLPALERVGACLQDGRLQSEDDLGFLVDEFPRGGLLLVLARQFLREEKHRKARNCVLKYEELGLGNRHSALLLAEILRAEGDEAGAAREEWRALKGFLGADAAPSESV